MKRKIFRDLDAYLTETGTTQAELAARLGVSQTCISLIRSKKRAPRPRLAMKIAEEARIPLDSLMFISSVSDNE